MREKEDKKRKKGQEAERKCKVGGGRGGGQRENV